MSNMNNDMMDNILDTHITVVPGPVETATLDRTLGITCPLSIVSKAAP